MIRLRTLLATAGSAGADRRGTTLTEFGLIAPIMITMMMGAGDLLYAYYLNAIVVGAAQEAGRDGTLQMNANSTATTALDNQVMAVVRNIAPDATFVSARENYSTFSVVDKPEPHTDRVGGTAGVRDSNECFSDTNGNTVWDADGGRVGVGGANDVAQYTITVTYPRLFPVAKLLGWPASGSIRAQTVLKNQPYAAQASNTAVTICP